MKSTLIVTLIACLSLIGLISFVVYKGLKPATSTKKVATVSQKTATETPNSTPGGSITLGASTEKTSDSIPLENSSAQQSQNTSQPKLLDPSQFSEYEQYKTSDKYLRIDATVGTGAEAVTGKKVAVFYKGYLTNGQIFDQSRADEAGQLQPFVFTPGAREVISGWEEGILGMKVGGIRRLVLPPLAGYGDQDKGSIPPNSVLIFDIQLLEVEQ